MLILLLPTTFLILFLTLCGYHADQKTPLSDWRLSFLQTATLMGGYMVLFSELLSLFHALETLWVALFWGIGLISSVVIGWKKNWISRGASVIKSSWHKPDGFDILAGSISFVIIAILFFIAIKSPINNNDSLQYHMARVAHWIQDQSLDHYPTAFIPQLVHPLFAELAILNGYLLFHGVESANLVQWSSLVGATVGVTFLALLLGAKKNGQWGTRAFVLSLPVVILEATSTQNDMVVSFWLICLLVFIFRAYENKTSWLDIFSVGTIIGLGFLTKGTFFPYAVFPIILFIFFLFRNGPLKKVIAKGILITVLILVINGGNWTRNIITFGTPLGSSDFIATFTSRTLSPLSNAAAVSRNILQNFATPDEQVNKIIVSKVKSVFGPYDPISNAFTLNWGWNHEDLAGNPLHAIIIGLSIFTFILLRKRIERVTIWLYLGIEIVMYISLALVVRYDPYGNRYQLPFFIAWAPLFGMALELIRKPIFSQISVILLLLASFPWVLFNRTRPLIAMRDSTDPFTIPCLAGCTTGSILNEPPEKTMFAVWGDLGSSYVEAMHQVQATGCQNIGLKLDSSDLEYAYWYLLGAPQNGMRLESIVTYPELERYLDPSFKPCVIICTTCGNQETLFGLDRIGSYGNGRIKIFSGDNYNSATP